MNTCAPLNGTENTFNFITKSEISSLIPDFPRNRNGEINGSFRDFRRLHQEINCSPYPINNDGSPDMRCTKNPHILKLKLNQLIKEKNYC